MKLLDYCTASVTIVQSDGWSYMFGPTILGALAIRGRPTRLSEFTGQLGELQWARNPETFTKLSVADVVFDNVLRTDTSCSLF